MIAQVERAWGLTIRDGFGQTETTLSVGNTVVASTGSELLGAGRAPEALEAIVDAVRETLGAETWYAPVGPSAVRSPREPTAPRALTEPEIEKLIGVELF